MLPEESSGKLHKNIHTNKGGFPYEILNGSERVYFEGGTIKGFFDKNGNIIGQPTVVKTTKRELITACLNIATFCKMEYQNTSGETER